MPGLTSACPRRSFAIQEIENQPENWVYRKPISSMMYQKKEREKESDRERKKDKKKNKKTSELSIGPFS